MTVFEIMTRITFMGGIFSAGFTVGRIFEKFKSDRH